MTLRRGVCPGLADPLPTGDGLLARLALARAIPLDACAALCTAAQEHGNGIIEITSRGSIQVRGLTATSAPAFAAAVKALDIVDAAGGRVLGNPLAGLDPHEIFDVTEVVDRLRDRILESGLTAKLAPKVSVVVDGGGALHLDAIPCDIRLRADSASGATRFHVTIGNESATALAPVTIAPEHAVATVFGLLHDIAAQGPTARARDLHHPARLAGFARPRRAPADPVGTHELRDGSVAFGVGLPFGHSDAATLQTLIEQATHAGAASVRPVPGRVLLLVGIPPAQVSGLTEEAERLGFITNPEDPRRRVVACSGAPACTAAEIPTRALAPAIAAARRLDVQTTIHISGCAKGCAHSAPADVTIVGINGKCGIVPNGRAHDAPTEFVAPENLVEYVAQRSTLRELAHG
jgi:precorrin-3B synthase